MDHCRELDGSKTISESMQGSVERVYEPQQRWLLSRRPDLLVEVEAMLDMASATLSMKSRLQPLPAIDWTIWAKVWICQYIRELRGQQLRFTGSVSCAAPLGTEPRAWRTWIGRAQRRPLGKVRL